MPLEPGSPEWAQRLHTLAQAELAQPERLFYISYAGRKFIGAVILRAYGPTTAFIKTKRLGITPHGQSLTIPIPDDCSIEERFLDRLLTKEEVIEALGPVKTPSEFQRDHKCAD